MSDSMASEPRSLMDLKKGFEGDDPNELIKNRFLCKGGGLLLVGPTGIGKSSFARQMAILFALGKDCVGLTPKRALSILIIQAENDETDEVEMRDGVLAGNSCTEDEKKELKNRVFINTIQGKVGKPFFDWLASVVEKLKPDLLIIDPVLAYIGGDANLQNDVGSFLRDNLAPLLMKYQCAAVLIHHTAKLAKKVDFTNGAYLGSGSAEWANWPRAILFLENKGKGNFILHATKRGKRLTWIDANGEACVEKHIAHSTSAGMIYWEINNEPIKNDSSKHSHRPTPEELAASLPKDLNNPEAALILFSDTRKYFTKNKWDKNSAEDVREQAIKLNLVKTCSNGKRGKFFGLPEVVDSYLRKNDQSELAL